MLCCYFSINLFFIQGIFLILLFFYIYYYLTLLFDSNCSSLLHRKSFKPFSVLCSSGFWNFYHCFLVDSFPYMFFKTSSNSFIFYYYSIFFSEISCIFGNIIFILVVFSAYFHLFIQFPSFSFFSFLAMFRPFFQESVL